MNATISREQLNELTEVIEDSVQFICDQEMISGEKAWAVLECLAIAKQAELSGVI
ncbi:hypothetical protein [Synechococcus sp. WH 8016]|uniref:hypothetical protein n=1 Tax=Synechococcus sp. WH 8016 TaxID=166318 RepID=UPI00022D7D71|nr:hypothetical protein [Synechococcus sp. WH 8016]EHA63765.1 hypothetical protein Syn8016DRAFT_0806 [Synechococcus sp. WH 8016]